MSMSFFKRKRQSSKYLGSTEQQNYRNSIKQRLSLLKSRQGHSDVIDADRSNPHEEISPEKSFWDYHQKERNNIKKRILIVLLAEMLLIGVGVREIVHYDLQGRTQRELGIELNGQIDLETGTYTGETEFGQFNGTGEYVFNTRSIYSGEWEDNLFSGEGTLLIPSEGTYVGGFYNGKKNGTGTFTWTDGTVYDGEWNDDQMTGEGVYQSVDGVMYSGTFQGNTFQTGHCTFENSTGKYDLSYRDGSVYYAEIEFTTGAQYSGACSNTNLEGSGTMSFGDDDVYTGSYEHDQRNGNGTYTWANGDTYTGSLKNDKMAGEGSYVFSDGSKLEGVFSNNAFTDGQYLIQNDYGEYDFTFSDGSATYVKITLLDGTKYEGEMTEESLTGSAQITYSNGDQYLGSVIDGQKSGSGVYTWANGAKYDGVWLSDTINGRGTYTYPKDQTGFTLTGNFSEGLPDGKCTYYVSAKEHYETEWENGKCVKVIE